jgi:hypothetical protein
MKRFLIFINVLCLISCQDFLYVEPRQAISITQQFSTIEGANQALLGAYQATENTLSSYVFLYYDLQGGNLTFNPTRTGSNTGVQNVPSLIRNVYNFEDDALSSNFNSTYNGIYTTLNNINNIITYSKELEGLDKIRVSNIQGEAFALRALNHHTLLKLYSQHYNFTTGGTQQGIVYADKILQGGKDFLPRNSVAECYELIIKDLNTALSLFSNATRNERSYTYLNSITTKALLARIALEKGDYPLAKTTATDIIITSGIVLMNSGNYISEWTKFNDPPSEVILELAPPRDLTSGTVSSSVSEYYNIIKKDTSIVSYGSFSSSQKLLSLFEERDIRKSNFIKADLNVKVTDGFEKRPFYFTRKHQDNAGTLVMRLSEIYLILAEANARLNDQTGALFYLNVIRTRANLIPIPSSSSILEEIFLERQRELCFEGHLFYDYARFKKNVDRGDNCFSNICTLNYPNNRFILPIPQQSINLNQNMKQNEGY